MDVQKELYDAAARLAGASGILRGLEKYELDDDLIAANQLICSAREATMAALGVLTMKEPEVAR